MYIEVTSANKPMLVNLEAVQHIEPNSEGIKIVMASGFTIKTEDYSYTQIIDILGKHGHIAKPQVSNSSDSSEVRRRN
ncbi:hypothetical protein D770_11505 [Flammeovirgaceae bacterium 311]|nr:hypothetical protein D770_11505 [Flammeovirgaceae bacterium 311]